MINLIGDDDGWLVWWNDKINWWQWWRRCNTLNFLQTTGERPGKAVGNVPYSVHPRRQCQWHCCERVTGLKIWFSGYSSFDHNFLISNPVEAISEATVSYFIVFQDGNNKDEGFLKDFGSLEVERSKGDILDKVYTIDLEVNMEI